MEQLNKVLIVDDDTVARFLVERILTREKISKQILTASNGEEALELLKSISNHESYPDLIFLDIKMPVMDGFEFLEALQHSGLSELPIKIVLLTSSHNQHDVERAKNYSVAAYLIKPLVGENLSTIIA
ncbi:response regulator [Adhaeribacter radiodurans]|uniref:Response regulator n=1 Tax=Adhaeribacter radiodurans TaxID=2745197 RepID=A0A7L7LER4_9BACT|nr:response regulator [Adhaeribacter radiodurans]QMU30879.1 response regulator [Adhaeribacter radiodurans]